MQLPCSPGNATPGALSPEGVWVGSAPGGPCHRQPQAEVFLVSFSKMGNVPRAPRLD